ncbi:hypothetical protein M0812_14378 [Anaeramoeba flamelloides]|uniref:Uncharacterized protein n=1 Tax=Anaeramoeba flamelloides TaxID=1746091 RepID=A0AAV7ZJ05_9EUKA|nr:hypothetical protein M0812_14378 [Anaeramoeba flamelloides]
MKYQLVPTNNTASESSSVVSGSDSVTDDDLELKSFRPILPSNNQKKKTETNTFLQLNSSENEKEENILKKTLLKQNKDDEVHIAPSKDPYPRYQSDPNYEKKQIFSNENYGSGTYPSISNNNNNISYPHPIAAFCVVCLGYGFSLLITYLCFKIFNKDNSQKDFVYLGMYGVSTLFFSLTINAFCLIRKYDPYSIFRFYKPEGPRLILVFSSIIPILMMSLYFFITVVAGIYRNAKEEGLSEMHVAGFWNAIVIIVTTALIPGFCEGIFF